MALIAAIILAGLVLRQAPRRRKPRSVAPLTFSGFIAALVAALWAYDGWNNVSMVSSEIKDPQRNLPRALIGGTLCVIAIYMLANAAYFHVMAPVGSCRQHPRRRRNDAQDLPGARAPPRFPSPP